MGTNCGSGTEARMTKAQKLLTRLRAEKTSVLSPEILARVDKIAKNKGESIAFLKKGGFLDRKGKLAPKYRLPSSR
jgi:hypothetical protein